MKYLKSIFESLDKIELLDFCETNLAYLLDDETYKLKVQRLNKYYWDISIQSTKGFMSWTKIKDYIIPFIKHIDNKYKLETIHMEPLLRKGYVIKIDNSGNRTSGSFSSYYNIDDLENAYIGRIDQIEIRVKR
jgi:hypothetical protein